MPRISEQLNRRSRKLLRPKELPTWWSLFTGGLGVVVFAFLGWNLIAGRGGVPATPTASPATVAPVATVPIDDTVASQPASSTPQTAPTPSAGTVELPTYAGTRSVVPSAAVTAAEALARGASGVVQGTVLRAVDAGVYLIDVTVDLDGAGPSAPGVVAVRAESNGAGSFAASRVG